MFIIIQTTLLLGIISLLIVALKPNLLSKTYKVNTSYLV